MMMLQEQYDEPLWNDEEDLLAFPELNEDYSLFENNQPEQMSNLIGNDILPSPMTLNQMDNNDGVNFGQFSVPSVDFNFVPMFNGGVAPYAGFDAFGSIGFNMDGQNGFIPNPMNFDQSLLNSSFVGAPSIPIKFSEDFPFYDPSVVEDEEEIIRPKKRLKTGVKIPDPKLILEEPLKKYSDALVSLNSVDFEDFIHKLQDLKKKI